MTCINRSEISSLLLITCWAVVSYALYSNNNCSEICRNRFFFFAFFCYKKNVMNEDVRWKRIMCQGNSKVNSLGPSDAIWRQEIWDPSQYPKRRLFVRSRKVSKPRDWYFELSYRFEIWQAHRQHCCRSACQISKWSDNSKYKSRGFETWRDLTERRLFGYWDGALGQHWPFLEPMLSSLRFRLRYHSHQSESLKFVWKLVF